MKILLVHNFYQQPGGEDNVFQSEGELLLRMGHEVERMVFSNNAIQSLLDRILTGFRAIYNPESAQQLRKKIASYHPDVIHLHNFLPIASPSIIIESRRSQVPIVLTLHNYRLICPSATLFYNGHIYEKSIHKHIPYDAIWKGVYRNSRVQTALVAALVAVHHYLGTWRKKVDCYIALTQFAKNKFEEGALGIPEGKIVIKPNFSEDHGCGLQQREDFFLFVGRLTEEKGVRVLLAAAVRQKFRLVILGDGPLKDLVKDTVHLHPNIEYLSFQSKLTVIQYLKRCRALLFPSIWYEGFPLIIAECLSTATPVIASDVGGMKEIVIDRVNGLLFECGNEFDLSIKIGELVASPGFAKKMAGMARSTYLSKYTPEKNYHQLVTIYEQAINGHLVAG